MNEKLYRLMNWPEIEAIILRRTIRTGFWDRTGKAMRRWCRHFIRALFRWN